MANCHPHRFRHTFAIFFLRAGRDAFALKERLGHSTLAMVNRYVKIVEEDHRRTQKLASPVDALKLR